MISLIFPGPRPAQAREGLLSGALLRRPTSFRASFRLTDPTHFRKRRRTKGGYYPHIALSALMHIYAYSNSNASPYTLDTRPRDFVHGGRIHPRASGGRDHHVPYPRHPGAKSDSIEAKEKADASRRPFLLLLRDGPHEILELHLCSGSLSVPASSEGYCDIEGRGRFARFASKADRDEFSLYGEDAYSPAVPF
jgi:hypothetical protein